LAAVSEWIAREYFETLGFLVNQPTKYQVAARPKRAEEEFDLLVINPHGGGPLPEPGIWNADSLKQVPRAVVAVRGWHTDRFSPAVLETSPEVFRFLEDEAVTEATRLMGPGPLAKVLCLPGLPATRDLELRSLEILRQRGVDGILSFRTMLLELAQRVDVNRNYDQSDLLQVIRLMKHYDLLKDPQLELFGRGRPRR